MIYIYVEQISERLIYTFDFVFKDRGIKYHVSNDQFDFKNSTEFKLNYSNFDFEGILKIEPAPILFDEDIEVYGITKGKFFQEECIALNLRNDPFGAIFYVLSRMEEYVVKAKDAHGRFQAKDSVMQRFNWQEKVMCDRWAEDVLNFLANHGINLEKKAIPFKMLPTFDIDNAFAYKHKNLVRRYLSLAKDFMKRDFTRLQERNLVLLGGKKDPYDTYDLIEEVVHMGFDTKIFWLLGDLSKYDRNLNHKNLAQQNLIKRLQVQTEIGIHPSYKSNTYEYYLFQEKDRLENIINKEVYSSRQHFLMLNIPNTYHILKGMGIKEDYSMGFAETLGFRAGTCRPFLWFDLTKNEVSDLIIHPFAYMDGTLNDYLKLTIDEAKQKVFTLFQEVKNFGGEFCFIWHNETIGDYGRWKGWSDVFWYTLNLDKNEA